ncbi:MAG: hypothetical protein WCC59_07560 [Terriglobales bacterium]
MKFRLALILIIALTALLTTSGMGPPSGKKARAAGLVPAGVWGGEHIRMEVDSAGAEIEFDCARGRILEPLALDANGRFRVKGTYKADTPAPMQAGDSSGANAIYAGTLEGDRLRLEVSVSGVEGIKSFDLEYGHQGHLAKCA